MVLLLLLGAAWLRFSNLATIPGGFHGDEAVVGLEAQRILNEGSIGPYSPLAMGQPAGPLYFTALSVRLFGNTIWAVRAMSALWGTLTVLVFYLLLRRQSGRTVAMVGAVLLATLDWHIHFSRLGFPIISWPLCVLVTVFAAVEATKRRQPWLWALTGVLAGFGIYSYNAHILFLLAFGLWFVFYLLRQGDVSPTRRVGWLVCFAGALCLTAVPMARYALDPANDYFSHARAASVFNPPDPNWPEEMRSFAEQKTATDKLKWFGERAAGFWITLSYRSMSDQVDASGVVPVVPLGVLVLAGAGWWLTRKRQRDELMALSVWCVCLLPLGVILTVENTTRRAFALAPFLVFFCAVGVVEIGKRMSLLGQKGLRHPLLRVAPTAGVALVCVLLAAQSLSDYFWKFAPTPQRAWTFVQDFSDTCLFLRTLPPTSRVLFYSDRWSCNYEPRRFLAPDLDIEDRSRQFGKFTFKIGQSSKQPVFVLMGLYLQRLPELKKKYPSARIQVGPPSGENERPVFVALWPQTP